MANHEHKRDKLFGENGCLRDGETLHVSMMTRDSMTPLDTEDARKKLLVTDGTDNPLGLHKPGWRIAVGGSERDVRLRDSQRKLF